MNEFYEEFYEQVVASHGLVATEILAGEQPGIETFVQLAAETLSVQKLTTLQCRSADTVREAKNAWKSALDCFRASEEIWQRLSAADELVENHRRLLGRLCANAALQVGFYSEADNDRMS